MDAQKIFALLAGTEERGVTDPAPAWLSTPQEPPPQQILPLWGTDDCCDKDALAAALATVTDNQDDFSAAIMAAALAAATDQEPVSSTSGLLFSQTQSVTVANTVTETDLTGTGVGSLTVPLSMLGVIGKTLKFTGWGYYSAAAAPTIRIRLYLGSTVLLDTTAVTSSNGTNDMWNLRGMVTVLTIGATGTVNAQGFYKEDGTFSEFPMVNTSTVTIDTTTSQALSLTAQWGTAAAANTITMTNFTVELL